MAAHLPAAAAGVIDSAVTAAVVPAVAAAVGPAVTAAIGPLMAKTDNLRIRNANTIMIVQQDNLAAPLIPLKKETAGVGIPLANLAPAVNPIPIIAVGNIIPLFPANMAAVINLTGAQINELSQAFNDDFGILSEDTIEVSRNKFLQWIRL